MKGTDLNCSLQLQYYISRIIRLIDGFKNMKLKVGKAVLTEYYEALCLGTRF